MLPAASSRSWRSNTRAPCTVSEARGGGDTSSRSTSPAGTVTWSPASGGAPPGQAAASDQRRGGAGGGRLDVGAVGGRAREAGGAPLHQLEAAGVELVVALGAGVGAAAGREGEQRHEGGEGERHSRGGRPRHPPERINAGWQERVKPMIAGPPPAGPRRGRARAGRRRGTAGAW